jgi:hypothetical protein
LEVAGEQVIGEVQTAGLGGLRTPTFQSLRQRGDRLSLPV